MRKPTTYHDTRDRVEHQPIGKRQLSADRHEEALEVAGHVVVGIALQVSDAVPARHERAEGLDYEGDALHDNEDACAGVRSGTVSVWWCVCVWVCVLYAPGNLRAAGFIANSATVMHVATKAR